MKFHGYVRTFVNVRLDDSERWAVWNDKGLPFHVREITYQGGEDVSLRGWAIKADGSQGVTDRYKVVPLAEFAVSRHALAQGILETYVKSLQEELDKVAVLP